jgi:hypothetical protein
MYMTRFELATAQVRNGHSNDPAPVIVPVRIKREWPLILRPMKLWARDGDQGLGDIIERKIGPLGGDAFKAWYMMTFGRPCGCNTRKESWNKRYPL